MLRRRFASRSTTNVPTVPSVAASRRPSGLRLALLVSPLTACSSRATPSTRRLSTSPRPRRARRRRDPPSVGREHDPARPAGVDAQQRAHAGKRVHPQVLGARRDADAAPVGGHAGAGQPVSGKRRIHASVGGVDDQRAACADGRGERAGLRERHRSQPTHRAPRGRQGGPRRRHGQAPETDRAVLAADHDLPGVGAERRDDVETAAGAEREQGVAAGGRPEPGDAVGSGAQEQLAVTAVGERADLADACQEQARSAPLRTLKTSTCPSLVGLPGPTTWDGDVAVVATATVRRSGLKAHGGRRPRPGSQLHYAAAAGVDDAGIVVDDAQEPGRPDGAKSWRLLAGAARRCRRARPVARSTCTVRACVT